MLGLQDAKNVTKKAKEVGTGAGVQAEQGYQVILVIDPPLDKLMS